MILYHGTNQDIEYIDLKRGLKYKDFGQGFYTTLDIETAKRMARKRAKFFGGTPIVIVYEIDESVLAESGMNILRFPEKATAEWITFVNKNRDRKSNTTFHGYDIIIGPIADDGVVLQLNRFRDSILTPAEAAIALQDRFLDQQFYFGTEASLKLLTKKDICLIK